MSETEHFRANVGAVITRPDGAVLALRRADVEEESWQLPQGGIDVGEEPEAALRREVREETGLDSEDYSIVGSSRDWLAYELPPEYRSKKVGRGQVQKWFHCRLTGDESKVTVDGVEFDAMTWLSAVELVERAVWFRQRIYRRVLEEFGLWGLDAQGLNHA